MSRKTDFPKVMCTQHPDSASKYIATQEEPGEAIEASLVFSCDEYMLDYEGKATPYHQNVQIVSKLEKPPVKTCLQNTSLLLRVT
jgi:phosphoenolpyruvate carboxylase